MDHIYVFLGEEGNLMATKLDDYWYPLVCTNEDLLKSMKGHAKRISKEIGEKISLYKFANKEFVEEIK